VARGSGIGESLLPWSATQDTLELTEKNYGEGSNGPPFKPSMLVDLEAGRPIEIEGIIGEVVRQGKEVNVPTPRRVPIIHRQSHIIHHLRSNFGLEFRFTRHLPIHILPRTRQSS
jgi:2-dehydropantoate 2-reductase